MRPSPGRRNGCCETGDASLIWEGHRAGREIGYCHLEKLSNLEALPSDGFQVACFPVKVHRGSAGWTRAVAILDGELRWASRTHCGWTARRPS